MDGTLVGNERDDQMRSSSIGDILNYMQSGFIEVPFHKSRKIASQKKLKKGGRRPGELKNVGDILRKRNKVNFMKRRKNSKSKER